MNKDEALIETKQEETPTRGRQPTSKDFLRLHLRDLPYFRALVRAVEAGFYQDLNLPTPRLDIGCGDGHFASLVFDTPIEVGIDPWTGPIREARKRGSYRSLVQGDAGIMPFPSDYFASALSNSVLEHIPHIDVVLAETWRVLQPGAPFVFCVPNPGYFNELSISSGLREIGLSFLADAYMEWFRRISRVHHADTPEVWQARLEQSGFCLESWWHYFSPQAMRVLEWGHFFGVPTLLPHLLTKRWILVPTHWNLALTERLVRAYSNSVPHPMGTFTFFIARKPK